MYSIKLEWKEFNVDLEAVEAWFKANHAEDGYCGNSADTMLTLWFTNELTEEQAEVVKEYWESIAATSDEAKGYDAKKTAKKFQAMAAAAMAFGNDMVTRFAGENLQLGITQAGKTKAVRVAMSEVMDCLASGSLIEAIAEIKAIPSASYDSKFITAARLLAAVNQLEAFCGLPLSTKLT